MNNLPGSGGHCGLVEKGRDEIRPDLLNSYLEALAALKEKQLESAISKFHSVLEAEPGFYECRQNLHLARLDRCPVKLALPGNLARSLRHLTWVAGARLTLKSRPARALRTGEMILDCDCSDLRAHKLIARAALRAGLPHTAVLSLDYIFEHVPEEGSLAVEYAATLAEIGDVTKAIALCGRLLRDDPGDSRLTRLMRGLADYARFDLAARIPLTRRLSGAAATSKAPPRN